VDHTPARDLPVVAPPVEDDESPSTWRRPSLHRYGAVGVATQGGDLISTDGIGNMS
jgi:hypothetical protein